MSPFGRRVEMLELALAGQPSFRIEEIERDRPGPSYTVDTLLDLRSRQPGRDLYLILGADCLADLPNWYQPQRIVSLASLLVVGRPGSPAFSDASLRSMLRLEPDHPARIELVQSPLIDISSTDIRRRACEKRSFRYLVPRAVECYIENHKLYTSLEPGGKAGMLGP
jgi:nicotinate-nucleotide adenylyltransferase